MQKKILYKINNLEFQNKTIIARLTTMEKCSNTKTPESQLLQLKEELLNLFPIKTVEDLTNLERRLNKKGFFDQVVSISVNSCYHYILIIVIIKIFRYNFSQEKAVITVIILYGIL